MKDCVHHWDIDSNDVGVCLKCSKRTDFHAMQEKKPKKGEDRSFVQIAIPYGKITATRWEKV